MHLILRALSVASMCVACALFPRGAAALTYTDVDSFAVSTNATMMFYSPLMEALVLKNAASTIVAIDIEDGTTTTRLANTRFTDMSLSPSGRYVFAADYGGENIGYGTPAGTHYVHRLDLATMTWDMRTAYIAGNVQAVSDTQLILKSIDQWVTFTNNAWGSGSALVPLNTPSPFATGPTYIANVYSGDFRYDSRTARLVHGNSGVSSHEIQAFGLANNEFLQLEGSGLYGSASGYGGSVVLATDGSLFYYGALQVDALDVSHDVRVFPDVIRAANGSIALGNGKYYDAHTGALLGSLPFSTTVYAMNPSGDDFWAFDPASLTVHHFAPSVADANVALAASGGVATASSNFSPGTLPSGAINGDRKGLNWNNGGGWKSAAGLPQWLQVQFAGLRTVDRVVLYDVQDNYTNPVEPTDSMTNSLYGSSFIDFTVSAWINNAWLDVAAITGNNLVKRTVTFPAVSTDRVRVNITQSADPYGRLAEIEAFTAVAQGGPASTTTALASSANPSLAGVPVTFTATVSGNGPTGNVVFTDNGISIAGCAALPLTGSGNARIATCATSALDPGTQHIIAAIYSGNASNAASGSNVIAQTVNLIPTMTSLTSTPNPSIAGTPITFTVTVTGSDPSGYVDLQEGSIYISGCSGIALTGSGNVRTGTCNTSALSVGTHSLAATYYGNITNARSSSGALQQVVTSNQAVQSTTAIASSANPSITDAFVIFTATVTGNNPTGPIFIADGDLIICSDTLVGSGNSRIASCGTSLGTGTHSMTAFYQGDYGNFASTSSPLSQVVNLPSPSSTTIASSANPSSSGSAVTFTASVTANNPTGSVSFSDNGNAIAECTALPFTGGSGSFRTTTCSTVLEVGTHPIAATYSGDAANVTSTSSTLSQVIVLQTPSSTTLTSPVTSSFAGAYVIFTATVSGNNPTGTVFFGSGQVVLCTSMLTGSADSRTATCPTPLTAVGTQTVVAAYQGDVANIGTPSNPLTHDVLPAGPNATTSVLASSINPSSAGVGVTLTVTVNGVSPTGTVDFWDVDGPMSGCTAIPLTGSGNAPVATCVTAALAEGNSYFQASYTGDTANGPSLSNFLTQEVHAGPNPTATGISSAANPVPAGTVVVFTATVTGTNLSGRVSFTDGGNPIAGCTSLPFTGGSGNTKTSSCSTALAAGAHVIYAVYTGDSTNAVSVSSALAQAVNPPVSTTTTLASSSNPSLPGASVTFTATVNGTNPTGGVSFTDNGTAIAGCTSLPFTGGSGNTKTASCSAAFAAGTHSILAIFSGDLASTASVSSPLSQVVSAGQTSPTTTTLTSSPNPSLAGQTVTYTATVNGTNPTGTVSFTDSGNLISGCTGIPFNGPAGSHSALCFAGLPAGMRSIVATYSGDAANAASASVALSQQINAPAPTTTTLTSTPNPSLAGQTVTYTATVNGTNPTGSVSFTDNGNAISGCTDIPFNGPAGSHTALCFAGLPAGMRSIFATYSGDAANAASVSVPLSQQINAPAPTTTTLTSSPNPSLAGQTVTYTATVNGTNPTGTVSFTDSGNAISGCTGIPFNGPAGSHSALCFAGLPAGMRSIFATYSGDAANAASVSVPLSQQVNAPAPTTTTLTSTPNPSLAGQTVTYTATVNGTNPTGSVSFTDNGNAISGCTGIPFNGPAGSHSALCFAGLPAGMRSIFATYSGDAANAASVSVPLSQQINAPAPTTTTLTSSPNPSLAGQTVTYTATVNGTNPTGTVSFTDSGNAISGCTGIPFNGPAGSHSALCFAGLPAGMRSIFATYSGDAANAASVSVPLSQQINAPAPTTTTLTSTPNPSLAGQTVTYTATVNGTNPTGSVSFTDNGNAISGCTDIPFNGPAGSHTALCFAGLPAGMRFIFATYSGDAANAASISSPLSQVVNNASSGAAATFLGADIVTQGNWHGIYGADGYSVFSDATSYPAYAQVTPSGKADYIWASQPDSDPRALQRGIAAGRIAACWYGSVINVDVNLTDGADHKVTLYLVDWDSSIRAARIDVLDAGSDQVLATQNVTAFHNGVHLKWDLRGHVILRVTNTSASNAIISGIFFDALP